MTDDPFNPEKIMIIPTAEPGLYQVDIIECKTVNNFQSYPYHTNNMWSLQLLQWRNQGNMLTIYSNGVKSMSIMLDCNRWKVGVASVAFSPDDAGSDKFRFMQGKLSNVNFKHLNRRLN